LEKQGTSGLIWIKLPPEMKNLRTLITAIALLFPLFCFSASGKPLQKDSLKKDKVRCLIISGYAGLSQPSGNLASDYGSFGETGGGLHFLNKARWIFGVDGAFLFGGGVKNDPIPNLRNPDGTVSGTDGADAVFKVFQRGSILPNAKIGYCFPQSKPFIPGNSLGGFTLISGLGWLRHYTYIQDLSKKSPQFSDKYRIGYDRLATGLLFGLHAGYLFLPDNGKLNLHFELGYSHGFTKTARYSFVDSSPSGKKRNDGLIQLRLRICFTVKSRAENTSYYY